MVNTIYRSLQEQDDKNRENKKNLASALEFIFILV